MNHGFIQLHRQLLNWEWYTDLKTLKLFLHCLLRANHTEQNWRGQTIKRGQFITSIGNLSNETGLTIKQVRTALDNLILTNEVGKQSTSQNTLITVLSYEKYQQKGKPTAHEKTNEGQTKGKRRATNNNDNKENNEIKDKAFEGKKVFLEWFNGGKKYYTGSEGKTRDLKGTDLKNFTYLNQTYSRGDFSHALRMMSRSGWVKENKMFIPAHYLRSENFDKYLNQEAPKEQKAISHQEYSQS